MENNFYLNLFNRAIKDLFKNAVKISLKSPLQAAFFLQTSMQQSKAIRIRKKLEKQNIHIPPFMIISVTDECNLACKGCYSKAQHKRTNAKLDEEKFKSVLKEARELGIFIIIIAGGEPLIHKGIINIMGEFPEIVFPVFTNGVLIDDDLVRKFKKYKNIIPVISIEGYEVDTDYFRGKGVYQGIQKAIKKLRDKNVFWGSSITALKTNFLTITDRRFVQELVDSGCKLFFFLEYVPVAPGTESLVLTVEQRKDIKNLMNIFRSLFPALFVAFPGEEEDFGGCLAAGRGFVHINSEGNLEPCPFAPFSDTNLRNISLKEGIQSKLFKTIRENRDKLSEANGGCALWEKREWIKSLLNTKP